MSVLFLSLIYLLCSPSLLFKFDLASLQSKFATVVCELEELRSRPVLLGACKLCPTLRSELDEKNALIKSLGKTKVGESSHLFTRRVSRSTSNI